jgi:predicted nucleic acid-binding protein
VALARQTTVEVMYLLDTNVISELRRPRPSRAVLAWLSSVAPDQVFLSAVTIGELQAGVENAKQQDAARAAAIEGWVDEIVESYNVLPMDGAAFRRWAQLMHRQPPDLIPDAMIAATALMHNLMVVTRNVRDFERLGVPVLDPFGAV